MGVRRNIADPAARATFVEGVLALKATPTPMTTWQFDNIIPNYWIDAPNVPVSFYDAFVIWHHVAMSSMTPPMHPSRNAAHSGPIFLPWHRLYLSVVELHMQRLLGDDDASIPYWDWINDQALPDDFGGDGTVTAPFDAAAFPVNLAENITTTRMEAAGGRSLRRNTGQWVRVLPRRDHAVTAMNDDAYDVAPWDRASTGFRNRIEGWIPQSAGSALHNRVHMWVGGDMVPGSSPNDPLFFLNHCNVDRFWRAWQTASGKTYIPQAADNPPPGHGGNDPLFSPFTGPTTPNQVENLDSLYTYDSLAVA